MDTLLELLTLSDPNLRFVVLGMILLGISSGMVGTFTLLRKRALLGDAIAHAVLPGVCLAFLLWGAKNPLILLVGATATGWLSLLVIDWITARSRIKADAAIGLTLSVFFGIGILLLTYIQHSGNAAQSGLDGFLFGKAAALVGDDLKVFGALSVLLIIVIVAFFKEFSLISFDPNHAAAIGLPVRLLEVVLATMTVLAVAVGIQAVGVVLMAAMLITPAAAARYWTDQLVWMVVLAAVFGAISAYAGAAISYIAPAMPTGPWVVVSLSLLAFFSMAFAPKRGAVFRYIKQRRNRRRTQEENVLKAMYQLGERKGKDFKVPLSEADIITKRAFRPTELKQILKRLVKGDFVLSSGNNWLLTESGLIKGKRMVKLHRLWEVYLNKHLHIAADHVHDDAEAIEHVITPELEEELEVFLDYPEKDPHDSQIPY